MKLNSHPLQDTGLVTTRRESLQAPSALKGSGFWKRLRLLRRGSLAVPAEDGQPALPLRANQPSFSQKPPLFAPPGLGGIPGNITVALKAESPSRSGRQGRLGKIRKRFFRRPTSEADSLSVSISGSASSQMGDVFLNHRSFIWNTLPMFSRIPPSAERPTEVEILLSKPVDCGGVPDTARGEVAND